MYIRYHEIKIEKRIIENEIIWAFFPTLCSCTDHISRVMSECVSVNVVQCLGFFVVVIVVGINFFFFCCFVESNTTITGRTTTSVVSRTTELP